jgi:hypothetical protein
MCQHRWQSIKEYFERPREDPIEHYVILDDYNDMGEYIDHLVLTSASTGLIEEDIQEALEILKK